MVGDNTRCCISKYQPIETVISLLIKCGLLGTLLIERTKSIRKFAHIKNVSTVKVNITA